MKDNNMLFKDVHNYTKYKLVEMLINNHQSKLKDLNHIEQIADDVMNVLGVCGLKYHQELTTEFEDI
tara:strand:- start:552 stop:752 length:201 start_codon:yes stop_codon:yes gene_type:complete